MAVKVGINGFGRIGRLVLRGCLNDPEIEVVAINDLTNAETLAHLFKYDSVHGTLAEDVRSEGEGCWRPANQSICRRIGKAALGRFGSKYVVEATGVFVKETAMAHLEAGAKKVVITAPAKNEDITIVMGVNHADYDPAKHDVVSNASCTTNCLAPVAKVIDEKFGIKRGLMTTVHAYTNDQRILDLPLRICGRHRQRPWFIPTTTGAAAAVGLVLPQLKGKLDGFAMRVPTPDVSVVDLTVELEKDTTAEEINAALKAAAEGELKGILGVSEVPLVSMDFRGDDRSSIVDAALTTVMEGNFAKVVAWYDNEWGYSMRVVDLVKYMASRA